MSNGNLYQNKGGEVFTIGIAPNYFGQTAGDVSPDTPSTLPASSREAAELVRDTWQTAHTEWLHKYTEGGSQGIFLTWLQIMDGKVTVQLVGQQLALNSESGLMAWRDSVSAVGVQGPAGLELVDFGAVSDNQIPILYHLPGDNQGKQVAADSGISMLADKLRSAKPGVVEDYKGLGLQQVSLVGYANELFLQTRSHEMLENQSNFVRIPLNADGSSTTPGYVSYGQQMNYPSPVGEDAAKAGSPLFFQIWQSFDLALDGLMVRVPANNPEVKNCSFRIWLGDYGTGELLYDSFTSSGGQTFTLLEGTSQGAVWSTVPISGSVFLPRNVTLNCEVFSSDLVPVVLAGQIVPTPIGIQFVPALIPMGREMTWIPVGGSNGLKTVVAGLGIQVDDNDKANPVISNTGVVYLSGGTNISIEDLGEGAFRINAVGGSGQTLLAGQGIQITPDALDPSVLTISSTGVAEVIAGTNVTVDASDPARPIVSAGNDAPTPWKNVTAVYHEGEALSTREIAAGVGDYLLLPAYYSGAELTTLGLAYGASQYISNDTAAPITVAVVVNLVVSPNVNGGDLRCSLLVPGQTLASAAMVIRAPGTGNAQVNFCGVVSIGPGSGFRVLVQNDTAHAQTILAGMSGVQITRLG